MATEEKKKSKYYITKRQREQAERMAAKWEARAAEYYQGGDGWGADVVGYCKTDADAGIAEQTARRIYDAISSLISGTGTWPDVQVILTATANRDEIDVGINASKDVSAQGQAPQDEYIVTFYNADENNHVRVEGLTSFAEAEAFYTLLIDEGFEASNLICKHAADGKDVSGREYYAGEEDDITHKIIVTDNIRSTVLEKARANADLMKRLEELKQKYPNAYQSPMQAREETQAQGENLGIEKSTEKNTFSIYQLKDTEETRDYRWLSLEELAQAGLAADIHNYDLVYTAQLDPNTDTLEDIYDRFNNDLPVDFRGHPLSISDIIVVNINGDNFAHYVDFLSFCNVPGFWDSLKPPAPEIAQLVADRDAGRTAKEMYKQAAILAHEGREALRDIGEHHIEPTTPHDYGTEYVPDDAIDDRNYDYISDMWKSSDHSQKGMEIKVNEKESVTSNNRFAVELNEDKFYYIRDTEMNNLYSKSFGVPMRFVDADTAQRYTKFLNESALENTIDNPQLGIKDRVTAAAIEADRRRADRKEHEPARIHPAQTSAHAAR